MTGPPLDIDMGLARGDFALSVTLRTGPGITVLAGPSGAGKSSVAGAIAGLARPDRGRIAVNGVVLHDSILGIDVPVPARRIGYVLQDSLLFPHLSVRRNLTYSHRPGDLTLDRVIDILGIGGLLERSPASLSGGEKQRVAIGRALLSGPALLIMDEPLASLDAARRSELMPFIEMLRDTLALPVLYITHNWSEIIRLADTVVLMEHGQVRAAGSLQAVLAAQDDYRHLVPDGSVIDAVPTAEIVDGLCRFETPAGPMFLPRASSAGSGKVRLFIDAHDVAIALRPPEDISVQNVLGGVIETLSVLDESHVDLRLALAGDQAIRARITRHASELLELRVGTRVYAMIKSVSFDRRLQWRGVE